MWSVDLTLRGEDSSDSRESNNREGTRDTGLALGRKSALGSWQVETENGLRHLMYKGLGPWEALISFPSTLITILIQQTKTNNRYHLKI